MKLNVVISLSPNLVKVLTIFEVWALGSEVRKKWQNFTKVCENFGESPNFVTNLVLIMSYILVKIFSPNMVKMRSLNSRSRLRG